MPRPKKDGKYVNYYMDKAIADKLERYCEDVGQTKTTAIERILKEYIDKHFEDK